MKLSTLHAVVVAAIATLPSIASGQLIAYEGFANGPLADLDGSNGGGGWNTSWANVSLDQPTAVLQAGLTYPGLMSTSGAAVTGTNGSIFPLSLYSRSFGAVQLDAETIYVSFLMRPDAGFGAWGGLSFGEYPFAVYVGMPLETYSFYGLMVGAGSVSFSEVPIVVGETAFVVVEISANTPAAGLTYTLYVNPTVGAAKPSTPAAVLAVAEPSTLPGALNIDNQGGFTTDEIRVSVTWEDAMPISPMAVGDLNHNDMIDAEDLGLLLGQWGMPGGDLNGDGTTNANDLAILLGAWGPSS